MEMSYVKLIKILIFILYPIIPLWGNSSLLLTHLGAGEHTHTHAGGQPQYSAREGSGGFNCLAQGHLIWG